MDNFCTATLAINGISIGQSPCCYTGIEGMVVHIPSDVSTRTFDESPLRKALLIWSAGVEKATVYCLDLTRFIVVQTEGSREVVYAASLSDAPEVLSLNWGCRKISCTKVAGKKVWHASVGHTKIELYWHPQSFVARLDHMGLCEVTGSTPQEALDRLRAMTLEFFGL